MKAQNPLRYGNKVIYPRSHKSVVKEEAVALWLQSHCATHSQSWPVTLVTSSLQKHKCVPQSSAHAGFLYDAQFSHGRTAKFLRTGAP